MNTNGHYRIVPFLDGPRRYEIRDIECIHCLFHVEVDRFKRRGDRSGLPKYNRARGVMLKHLHDEHRAEMSESETDYG